jgi:hypothetical protein
MAHSALNQQHSRLANHGLYFLLGMLSAGKHLESALSQPSETAPQVSDNVTAAQNEDLLYLCLGLLAFSQQLQSRLETERDLLKEAVSGVTTESSDAFSGALY